MDVITLKLDKQYWPAYDVHRTASGWVRKDFDTPAADTAVGHAD